MVVILVVAVIALVAILVLRPGNKDDGGSGKSAVVDKERDEDKRKDADDEAQEEEADDEDADEDKGNAKKSSSGSSSSQKDLLSGPSSSATDSEKIEWFEGAVAKAINVSDMEMDIDYEYTSIDYEITDSASEKLNRPGLKKEFTVGGNELRFSMKYDNIIDKGWECTFSTDEGPFEPGDYSLVTFEKDGAEITLWMQNLTDDDVEMSDLQIRKIDTYTIVDKYEDNKSDVPDLVLKYDNVSTDNDSDALDVINRLGTPDKISYDWDGDEFDFCYYFDDILQDGDGEPVFILIRYIFDATNGKLIGID